MHRDASSYEEVVKKVVQQGRSSEHRARTLTSGIVDGSVCAIARTGSYAGLIHHPQLSDSW